MVCHLDKDKVVIHESFAFLLCHTQPIMLLLEYLRWQFTNVNIVLWQCCCLTRPYLQSLNIHLPSAATPVIVVYGVFAFTVYKCKHTL